MLFFYICKTKYMNEKLYNNKNHKKKSKLNFIVKEKEK